MAKDCGGIKKPEYPKKRRTSKTTTTKSKKNKTKGK